MQECFIRFIMFYKFSQKRRNDSQQFSQLEVTFHLKLDRPAKRDKYHLIHLGLKLQQN